MTPRDTILTALDGAFDRAGWHGPNLLNSLKKLSPADAVRSVRGRKNAWQQLLHAAYWKYRVLRKFTGDQRLRFPRPGSNWPPVPTPADASAWQADLEMLRDLHRQLRRAVETAPASALTPRAAWLLLGAALHDVYHAGQVRLLRRMLADR